MASIHILYFTESGYRFSTKYAAMKAVKAETLILIDNMAHGLTFDKGNIFTLYAQEGIEEICKLIVSSALQVTGYKFIVLLCGRANLWDLDTVFKRNLAQCLNAIHEKNNWALVVLTATLPQPSDQTNLIKTASYRNRYMSQMAVDVRHLEFSRPGKHLLQLGKCSLDYFDEYYNLNAKGLDLIR